VLGSWCAFSAVRLAVGLGVPLVALRGVRAAPVEGSLSRQLAYALPIGLAGVVGTVNTQLDKLLVAGLFSAVAFAEYSVAARELPLVSILPYTVASALLPRLSGLAAAPDGAPRALDLWHASIRSVSLVMLPVSALLMGTAHTLVVLLYSTRGTSPARRTRQRRSRTGIWTSAPCSPRADDVGRTVIGVGSPAGRVGHTLVFLPDGLYTPNETSRREKS